MQPIDGGIPKKREHAGKKRGSQIAPVADCCGWDCANQQIAEDPTGTGCSERQHQNSEKIKPALDTRRRSAQRENEGTDKIERQHEGLHCSTHVKSSGSKHLTASVPW